MLTDQFNAARMHQEPRTTPTITTPPLAFALASHALPLNYPDDLNDTDLAIALTVADRILATIDGDERFQVISTAIEEYASAKYPDTHDALEQFDDDPLFRGTVQNAYSFPSLLIGFALAYRLLGGAR